MCVHPGVYLRVVPTWTTPERPEPPNNPVDERAALEDRLEYQRTTLLLKCGGLTPEQLAERSVPPSSLSLLGLVRHMSGVEAWFHSYDGQPDHMFFWNYVPGATDGFGGISAARAADDLASYQASVERSRDAVRDRGLDEAIPGEDYTLRWIYLHMIEEYARHNGHADLLRERIDGATGE
ncbi:DinB family protein [Nocardioides koreensis]|uniref:DinB family protein n=1 Tax=Nocardioides koreensis TaxID=433651 RepID=A0ABN3A8D7_9ACTN